jgi:hypothetical protein
VLLTLGAPWRIVDMERLFNATLLAVGFHQQAEELGAVEPATPDTLSDAHRAFLSHNAYDTSCCEALSEGLVISNQPVHL